MSDPGSGGSEFLSEFFRPSNDSELGKKKTNDSSFTPAATERERQSEERNGSGSKIEGLRHGDGLSDTKCTEDEYQGEFAAPAEAFKEEEESNSGIEIMASVGKRKRKGSFEFEEKQDPVMSSSV